MINEFIHAVQIFNFRGRSQSAASGEPGEVPLLTCNRYGKETVYYLNAPLFSDYIDVSPQQKAWCKELSDFVIAGDGLAGVCYAYHIRQLVDFGITPL